MKIGIVIKSKKALEILLKTLKFVNSKKEYSWVVFDDEVYHRNLPITAAGFYRGKEIESLFSDTENTLIITVAIYGNSNTALINDYKSRIGNVTSSTIFKNEMFIYCCDGEWIEIYCINQFFIKELLNELKGIDLNIEEVTNHNCLRRKWNMC